MQSPKHALAFQSEFKGVLYTPKLPINRTSGRYVIPGSFVDKFGQLSPLHLWVY